MRDIGEAQDILVSVVADINCKVNALQTENHKAPRPFGWECMEHINTAFVDDCIWKVVTATQNDHQVAVDTFTQVIKHIHFDTLDGRNNNVRLHVVNESGIFIAAQTIDAHGAWTSLQSRVQVVELLVDQAFHLMQLHFFGTYGFEIDESNASMPPSMLQLGRAYFSHTCVPNLDRDDEMVRSVLRMLDSQQCQLKSF